MSTPSSSKKTPTFGTSLPALRSVPSFRPIGGAPPEPDERSSHTQLTPRDRDADPEPLASVDPVDIPTAVREPAPPRESGAISILDVASSTSSGRRPGEVLAGRYRLTKILGEGGMGTVWEAQSLGLDCPVAIKLLNQAIEVPSSGNRLRKEAQAAARVVHPAAVRVFDFGVTDEGDPFLVMERLRGTPLSERLRADGPVRPISAVRLLLPVIEALVVAHHEGVIHCDLKPANILLVNGPSGPVPKLIDFGIARIFRRAERTAITRRGVLLGSPTYMSPEQIRGDSAADPRVDVWGACLVLFALCTGQRPFHAVEADTVQEAILWHDLPMPDELRAHPELWAILQRGLRKEPEQRWPSIVTLGRALATWAVEQGAQIDVMGTSIAFRWLEGRSPA